MLYFLTLLLCLMYSARVKKKFTNNSLFHYKGKSERDDRGACISGFVCQCQSNIEDQEHTLWMVKAGCKYLNPSNGAREQLVTNLRSIQRSFGSKPLITCTQLIESRKCILTS